VRRLRSGVVNDSGWAVLAAEALQRSSRRDGGSHRLPVQWGVGVGTATATVVRMTMVEVRCGRGLGEGRVVAVGGRASGKRRKTRWSLCDRSRFINLL